MKQLSDKQLAANRANAAKSTGPRTPEGKSRSSLNACKHGLAAASFSIPRLEDRNDFENLRADAIADYQPQTPQEMFAVERIALAQLSILRAYRLEAALFSYALSMSMPKDDAQVVNYPESVIPDPILRLEHNRNAATAEGFHIMCKQSRSWALVLRYQAQADRQYRRAVEDLTRLRQDSPNEPISDPKPTESKPHPFPASEASESREAATQPPAPGPRPFIRASSGPAPFFPLPPQTLENTPNIFLDANRNPQ